MIFLRLAIERPCPATPLIPSVDQQPTAGGGRGSREDAQIHGMGRVGTVEDPGCRGTVGSDAAEPTGPGAGRRGAAISRVTSRSTRRTWPRSGMPRSSSAKNSSRSATTPVPPRRRRQAGSSPRGSRSAARSITSPRAGSTSPGRCWTRRPTSPTTSTTPRAPTRGTRSTSRGRSAASPRSTRASTSERAPDGSRRPPLRQLLPAR